MAEKKPTLEERKQAERLVNESNEYLRLLGDMSDVKLSGSNKGSGVWSVALTAEDPEAVKVFVTGILKKRIKENQAIVEG